MNLLIVRTCNSTVMVAEVTQPSLGVGYEIGRAVDLEKRIICLFRPQTGKRMDYCKNYNILT